MGQNFEHALPVYAIKGLLEVHKIDVKGRVPLDTLLNDVAKAKYLVNTASISPEASLFLSQLAVNFLVNSLQKDTAKDLTWD